MRKKVARLSYMTVRYAGYSVIQRAHMHALTHAHARTPPPHTQVEEAREKYEAIADNMQVRAHMHTCVHMYAHVCTRIHTSMHAHMRTCARIRTHLLCVCVCLSVCVCVCISRARFFSLSLSLSLSLCLSLSHTRRQLDAKHAAQSGT